MSAVVSSRLESATWGTVASPATRGVCIVTRCRVILGGGGGGVKKEHATLNQSVKKDECV